LKIIENMEEENINNESDSLLKELTSSIKNPYNFKSWWNLLKLEKQRQASYYVS